MFIKPRCCPLELSDMFLQLDRASIIVDAIEFVKDLRKQVKDLQNELEEHSDDEDQSNTETSKSQQDRYQQNGMNFGYKSEREKISSRYHRGIAGNGVMDGPKQNQESQNIVDRVQQMEVEQFLQVIVIFDIFLITYYLY